MVPTRSMVEHAWPFPKNQWLRCNSHDGNICAFKYGVAIQYTHLTT